MIRSIAYSLILAFLLAPIANAQPHQSAKRTLLTIVPAGVSDHSAHTCVLHSQERKLALSTSEELQIIDLDNLASAKTALNYAALRTRPEWTTNLYEVHVTRSNGDDRIILTFGNGQDNCGVCVLDDTAWQGEVAEPLLLTELKTSQSSIKAFNNPLRLTFTARQAPGKVILQEVDVATRKTRDIAMGLPSDSVAVWPAGDGYTLKWSQQGRIGTMLTTVLPGAAPQTINPWGKSKTIYLNPTHPMQAVNENFLRRPLTCGKLQFINRKKVNLVDSPERNSGTSPRWSINGQWLAFDAVQDYGYRTKKNKRRSSFCVCIHDANGHGMRRSHDMPYYGGVDESRSGERMRAVSDDGNLVITSRTEFRGDVSYFLYEFPKLQRTTQNHDAGA